MDQVDRPKRLVETMMVACTNGCNRAWLERFSVPMRLSGFRSRLDKIRCPECASQNVHVILGRKYATAMRRLRP